MDKPPVEPVQYDQVAPTYDQRYRFRKYEGVTSTLHSIVQDMDPSRILEVGCGTGHWLYELQAVDRQIYGLDLSPGMLQEARKKNPGFYLACGQAWQLPFPDSSFKLVYCVNAFHHFAQPRLFIEEARRLLSPGGMLAIIGLDPSTRRDRWYIYDYFEGAFEMDVKRFPSGGAIVDWMASAGMNPIERRLVDRFVNQYPVQSVQDESFLQKNSTSQLILLSDEAYAAGLSHIHHDVAEAERQGRRLLLPVDISFYLVSGIKQI